MSVDEATGVAMAVQNVQGTWTNTGNVMNDQWMMVVKWNTMGKIDFLDWVALTPVNTFNGYFTTAQKAAFKLLTTFLSSGDPMNLHTTNPLFNLVADDITNEIVAFPPMSQMKWQGKQGMVDLHNEFVARFNMTTERMKMLAWKTKVEFLHANATSVSFRVSMGDYPLFMKCMHFNVQGMLQHVYTVMTPISPMKLWAMGGSFETVGFPMTPTTPTTPLTPTTTTTTFATDTSLLQQICNYCTQMLGASAIRPANLPEMCGLCVSMHARTHEGL